MYTNYTKTLLIIITLFFSTNLISQKNSVEPKIWFNTGIGLGSVGPGYGISLNLLNNKSLYKVRLIKLEELVFNIMGGSPTPEHVFEVGALYGFSNTGENGLVSFAAGVSYVGGMEKVSNDLYTDSENEFETVGLALEAQFLWSASQYTGFSATLFGNINSERPFGGVTLNFAFGKLK